MANTITSAVLTSSIKEATIYYNLVADGTTSTAGLTVYSSSTIATLVGDIDPLTSKIAFVDIALTSQTAHATTTAPIAQLLWKATTNVNAVSLPTGCGHLKLNAMPHGALPNQGAAGKTGDILLTAANLASGDSITIILRVLRK